MAHTETEGQMHKRHYKEDSSFNRAFAKHKALKAAQKDPRKAPKSERMKNFPDNYYV